MKNLNKKILAPLIMSWLIALATPSFAGALDGDGWNALNYREKGIAITGYISAVFSFCDKKSAEKNILCLMMVGGKPNLEASVFTITKIYSEKKYRPLNWEHVFPGAIAVGFGNMDLEEVLNVLDGILEKKGISPTQRHKQGVESLLD